MSKGEVALSTILTALLFVGGLVAFPTLALAHGGGVPRLAEQPVGPFELFAWTSPDPLRAGTMHVTVALAEPTTDEPILDAAVLVQVAPVAVDGEAQAMTARATHADAVNKVTYETDLQVPTAGLWEVTIDVNTSAGGGIAVFDVEVGQRSFLNWLLIGGAAIGVALAAWFLWPSGRRGSERSGERTRAHSAT